jgi:CdiI immunity protein
MLGAAASSSSSPHRQTPQTSEKADADQQITPGEEKKQPCSPLLGKRRPLPELDLSTLRKTASVLNTYRLENHLFRQTKIPRCRSLDVAAERTLSVSNINAQPVYSNNFDKINYLFDAYFGQDWKHSFDSIETGVESFFITESKSTASDLKQQVAHLINTHNIHINTDQLPPDLWLLEDFADDEQMTLPELVQTLSDAVEQVSKNQA